MTFLAEDYADAYGEVFNDGYSQGWDACEDEEEFGYSDEAHWDPSYEGYIQGYREASETSEKTTVLILKGDGLSKSGSQADIPMHQKFLLTIEEASQCYGLGVKTLYRLIHNNPEADYILEVGSHYKIKRELFEEYLRYSTNLD